MACLLHPPDVITSRATSIKRMGEPMTVGIQISSGKLLFWDCRQRLVSSMVTILSHSSSSMPFAECTLVQAILNTSTLTRVTFAAPVLIDRHDTKSGINQ
jgi:hypothetical protein